ncbi:thiamine pyrophosphate-binding protein [Microbacterium sp. zg.B48]|uniref:thiamine pyrophosphate-binding protein n=1 Tax=Microbacterium sp. zg.B48 TaxID=2969408 RepID=UPI00214AF9A0|nr:thiamine pyrophosphate-binding protein [Microbacterium sp. zg.B48]MCR2763070.1 thiamine pyrophosphate-binding protein [Microbacterium sp. zg.B48]
MTERITVAEAIGRTIASRGGAHIFGVVGSGNFHVTNAMIDAGMPFTATRHEMGAATMADAFSRTTPGRLAVLSVHQGCGLTNALTGIAEAAKCHTPLLVVTGDTAAGDVTSNFYIDQDAAVASVGATPARIRTPASAVVDTAAAIRTAVVGRETVVLSLPVDLQEEYVDFDEAAIPLFPAPAPSGPSPEELAHLVGLLTAAERPVIVGGRGAWGAKDELRRLAAASGALLVTSAAGRGLFVEDEWALDVMGGFATEGAAELISGADVLVAFGAALNTWTTRSGELLQTATTVQVDDRADAIGLHRTVDLGIVGDAASVAAAVADAVHKRAPGKAGYRTPDVAERVRRFRYWKDQPFTPRPTAERVDPQELTNALDAILPIERVVVPDGGNVNCYPGAHLRVPDERGYCIPLSFQAIGMGLAAGIGAGVAQPDRLPVVGTGDGAFLMSLVELDTAVRLGLGMVVIVYNDDAYGAEVNLFEPYTDKLDLVRFPETDIAAIARGYGCEGITVRSVADLDAVRDWVDGPRDRPLVIDAKIAKFPSWLMARRHRRSTAPGEPVRISH